MSLSIFCSYSHKDEDFRNELKRRLFILQQTIVIIQWHDRRIGPGEEWRGQIDSHLRSAQIILLLVSADFLASAYCSDVEIKLALERHAQGQAVVIPIIVRLVDRAATPFAHLQVLPSDGKPVIFRSDYDRAFAEIASAIPALALRQLPPTVELSVQQGQSLMSGLMQMIVMLQINRRELKDMVLNEAVKNPALEIVTEEPPQAGADPFENIDFSSFFDPYLDPGSNYFDPESCKKPLFESSFSSLRTLKAHLQSQLNLLALSESVRQAAHAIVVQLEENGYLVKSLEEIATIESLSVGHLQAGLKIVQSLEPRGIGARNLCQCLLLQLEALGEGESVAWKIVHDHLTLLENQQLASLANILEQPLEEIQRAVSIIRHLDPAPGFRYPGTLPVEPDVYITKEGDEYIVTLNDDDIPQLRLNTDYQRIIDREQEINRQVRHDEKQRYDSALQLFKNIETRKQTILWVCQAIVRRQGDFFKHGIDHLKPMIAKDVAKEIGVHASTVSRAVANKWARTPHGVLELMHFFSE